MYPNKSSPKSERSKFKYWNIAWQITPIKILNRGSIHLQLAARGPNLSIFSTWIHRFKDCGIRCPPFTIKNIYTMYMSRNKYSCFSGSWRSWTTLFSQKLTRLTSDETDTKKHIKVIGNLQITVHSCRWSHVAVYDHRWLTASPQLADQVVVIIMPCQTSTAERLRAFYQLWWKSAVDNSNKSTVWLHVKVTSCYTIKIIP